MIGQALQLIDAWDRLDASHGEEMRAQIAVGIASLRAGKTVDGEAVFDRLDKELDAEELQASK